MGRKSKAIGILFVGAAIMCFLVNFGIWRNFSFLSVLGFFFNQAWFWNPLSLLTANIVSYVPSNLFFVTGSAVSSFVSSSINYLFAGIYSIFLLFLGKTALFHKSKKQIPYSIVDASPRFQNLSFSSLFTYPFCVFYIHTLRSQNFHSNLSQLNRSILLGQLAVLTRRRPYS
jgi:hypothetical protein